MKKNEYQKVVNLTGYKPNRWQTIVEQVDAQFKIIMAGRRSGKTRYIIDSPTDGVVADLLRENQYVWIVAPNYDLTQRIWVPLIQYARGKFNPFIKRIWDTKGNFRIDTHLGTTIEAKSAEEPEKLVGVGLTKLVIDEFNKVKEKAWYESLRPTLIGTTEKKTGKAFFIGTPKGQTWGWEIWKNDDNPIDRPFGSEHDKEAQLEEEELKSRKWASFRFTTYDNMLGKGGYLTEEDIRELVEDMPSFEYQQEILAEITPSEERVFRNIKDNIREKGGLPKEENAMGIDLGRKGAYSVIAVVGRKSRYLKHIDRFRKISWTLQIGRIKKAIEEFKPRPITVDATGIGDPIIEELEKAIGKKVKSFIFTEIPKKQLVEKEALWIENGYLTYPEIPAYIKEMERYGKKKNLETGNYKYRPIGSLSSSTTDCIMAVGLAIWPIKIYSNEPTEIIQFTHQKY